MAPFQWLSPSMRIPIEPATALFVLHSFRSLHARNLSTLQCLDHKVPNIWGLTLPLLVLQSQMSTSDAFQASSTFKTLDPFFRHPLISQKFKLCVYSQIVQAILPHGSEFQVYSPAQIIRIDRLHYKALRQIFQIKGPYFHRVISPTDSPCSNEFLLSLAYPVLPSCVPSSLRISDSRLKNLGHILRHPCAPESIIMFNPSFSLRTISSPFLRGAPRAHWPELSLAEAFHRYSVFNTSAPLLWQFLHEFYRFFTIVELKAFAASSMKQWYDTTRFLRVLLLLAENQEQWVLLPPQNEIGNQIWARCCGRVARLEPHIASEKNESQPKPAIEMHQWVNRTRMTFYVGLRSNKTLAPSNL